MRRLRGQGQRRRHRPRLLRLHRRERTATRLRHRRGLRRQRLRHRRTPSPTEATFPVTVGPDLTFNGGARTPSWPGSTPPARRSTTAATSAVGEDDGERHRRRRRRQRLRHRLHRLHRGELPGDGRSGPDLQRRRHGTPSSPRSRRTGFSLFVDTLNRRDLRPAATPSNTVTVNALGGFDDDVILVGERDTAAGSTAHFSVNPVIPPGSSVLHHRETPAAAASPGSYVITVTGTAVGERRRQRRRPTLDVGRPASAPKRRPPGRSRRDGATGQPGATALPVGRPPARRLELQARGRRRAVLRRPRVLRPAASPGLLFLLELPIDLEENSDLYLTGARELGGTCAEQVVPRSLSSRSRLLSTLPFADGF